MSYRNDHDAALARIETFERENARLERENVALQAEKLVANDPPSNVVAAARAVVAILTLRFWFAVALIRAYSQNGTSR